MKAAARAELPTVSPGVHRVFTGYTRGYVRRHFHALRILAEGVPRDPPGPLVIYLNHASWWDPLVCLLLSQEYFADRRSFAPIDSAMLARYGFFRRLGFFGIDASPAGARTFLQTAGALLAEPQSAIWLTPQGRFTDVRERPLRLQRGLGALAAQAPQATFLPLAIEYAFWTEPRPEILVSFGAPIVPADEPPRDSAEWTQRFSTALATTQDALAAASSRRVPAEFQVLNRGTSGIGAIYDGWRWLRARLRGEKFSPEHRAEVLR